MRAIPASEEEDRWSCSRAALLHHHHHHQPSLPSSAPTQPHCRHTLVLPRSHFLFRKRHPSAEIPSQSMQDCSTLRSFLWVPLYGQKSSYSCLIPVPPCTLGRQAQVPLIPTALSLLHELCHLCHLTRGEQCHSGSHSVPKS